MYLKADSPYAGPLYNGVVLGCVYVSRVPMPYSPKSYMARNYSSTLHNFSTLSYTSGLDKKLTILAFLTFLFERPYLVFTRETEYQFSGQ